MQFDGFEVFPCGNAVLTINNNVLTVSGIGDSGLDGVLIKVENTDSYVVNFGSLETISQNNGVLKASPLVKNSFGQVVPQFESFKWYDEVNNKIVIGYNSSLLPDSYSVFGKLNGQPVFDINNGDFTVSSDPNFPPPTTTGFVIAWPVVVAAAAVAVSIWAALRTSETRTTTYNYDADGNLTGSSLTISEDPVPFDIEVNGTIYTVTEYGINYDSNLPPQLIGLSSIEAHPVAEQITGCNLSSFEITSIQSL